MIVANLYFLFSFIKLILLLFETTVYTHFPTLKNRNGNKRNVNHIKTVLANCLDILISTAIKINMMEFLQTIAMFTKSQSINVLLIHHKHEE